MDNPRRSVFGLFRELFPRWTIDMEPHQVKELTEKRFPEVHDFVYVTIDHVEYYGYIDHIDFDMRTGYIRVEFFPGCRRDFDFDEVILSKFPAKV